MNWNVEKLQNIRHQLALTRIALKCHEEITAHRVSFVGDIEEIEKDVVDLLHSIELQELNPSIQIPCGCMPPITLSNNPL